MNYTFHSFRHASVILEEDFGEQLIELNDIILDISEADLIEQHKLFGAEILERTPKSLSPAINQLLKERFVAKGWAAESPIFQNDEYNDKRWRLDFAKEDISIEVAFNHGEAIAWNLTKPVLASELNHVQKAIQTKVGVVITATEDLKKKGGFDGAVGTYEKFLRYLPPLRNQLTSPLLIIGLEAPSSFHLESVQLAPRKKIGKVIMHE